MFRWLSFFISRPESRSGFCLFCFRVRIRNDGLCLRFGLGTSWNEFHNNKAGKKKKRQISRFKFYFVFLSVSGLRRPELCCSARAFRGRVCSTFPSIWSYRSSACYTCGCWFRVWATVEAAASAPGNVPGSRTSFGTTDMFNRRSDIQATRKTKRQHLKNILDSTAKRPPPPAGVPCWTTACGASSPVLRRWTFWIYAGFGWICARSEKNKL